MSASNEPTLLTSDQILRIANEDAIRAYRNLSGYRIDFWLANDGWHVDYEIDVPGVQGGGPHYLIDPTDGTILSKRYEQ